jgi:formylglycine-generating enzyme
MGFRCIVASSAFAVALASACTRAEPQNVAFGTTTLNASLIRQANLPSEDVPGTEAPKNATSTATTGTPCPDGMLLIEGDYCTEVEQTCLEWMDPPGRYHNFRCAKYAQPSVCKGKRVHMRYCIDRTERTEADSKTPKNFVSYFQAANICAQAGGRTCKESEWVFACEGEEMRPYPYGYERDPTACNTDVFDNLKKRGRLVDHRTEAGSHERCASPFGVQDLAGNMEEWVAADGGNKMGWKQVLKGSWWIPSRHACRQFQVGHGPEYSGAEIGTRCCKDLP